MYVLLLDTYEDLLSNFRFFILQRLWFGNIPHVPRFKLTIEYAGTRYSGWQIQKNARTIQGEIDRAVRTVTGRKDFELYGSGRTDAGVHALAQVAHLDVSTTLPPDTLRRRINDELPSDINILSAVVVAHRFHARHDAVSRRYLYQISRRRTAFAKAYVWWVKEPLDVKRMRLAAEAFVGMRDFRAFTPPAPDPLASPDAMSEEDDRVHPRSTVVLLERIEVVEDGDLILVGVEGSHFLWKMVRRIVGVLVEIGRGGLEPQAAAQFLVAASPMPARLTAPPAGLFLERVLYERDSPPPDVSSLRATIRIESI
jgi:tRNA pseudouridine38-40 synthase